MQTTERSFLLKPSQPYVEITGLRRNNKIRIHKLRCCYSAAIVVLLVMAIVALVSYFTNSGKTDATIDEPLSTNELKLAYDYEGSIFFPPEELRTAIEHGNDAIRDRYIADITAKELPRHTPSSRHQYATSTSLKAKKLTLAAVGELAATKMIEKARQSLNMPSAFGRHFDVGWVPKGGCKEFSTFNCTTSKYRTMDGTCNHRNNYGAAFTPFKRLLPPDYSDGIDAPRASKLGNELPSAREVSLNAHKPEYSKNPSFTVMVAAFGQFLDHDVTATAISKGINGKAIACCMEAPTHPECFPVKMTVRDPNYKSTQSLCMEFVRAAPAPQCKLGPREQLNQVTAFIDGSMIYGSDNETSMRLRKGSDGHLHMIESSFHTMLLPPSKNLNDGCNREQEAQRGRYCFDSGDPRANENLHLTAMHVIWARQHNNIASKLKEINPTWDDEKLFQEARRIIGAQLQHITYNELLPVILGDNVTEARNLKPLKSGFRKRSDKDIDPSIANSFAASAFRFAHTLIPGLMKVANGDNSSDNYVILHRILFNPYQLYQSHNMDNTIRSVLLTSIQKSSPHVSSELSLHLFEDSPRNNTPVIRGLDLVSLNIQRGRDHGLPSYPKWREYCVGEKLRSFDDLKGIVDNESQQEITRIYDNIDDVDLYTGALAEIPLSDGLIGPTFACIIGNQFERLLKGDRYWYEYENEDGSFTKDQLNELKKTTLARVICDCSDNITKIQPKVMLIAGEDNAIKSCDTIPEMDLSFWKEQ